MKEHAEGTTIYERIIIEIAPTPNTDVETLDYLKLGDEVTGPITGLLDGLNCPDFTFRIDES